MTDDIYDEIEVEGEKYAVVFEENSIPGRIDAVVADYSDRVLLENDREQAGTEYRLDESDVEGGDPLKLVRDRILESKNDKKSNFEMEGIEAL